MKETAKSGQPRLTKAVLLVYLAAALALSLVHDHYIDRPLLDIRQAIHQQVLNGTASAPIQYRVMVYYAAEFLMKAGVPLRESYDIVRTLFIFLSAVAFQAFLSFWFVPLAAFAGTLCLLAVLPLTFIGYYMQPMDIPNLFFFLLGCILILKRRDWLLVPLLIVAMFNRETAILIVPVYFFVRYDELPLKDLALRTSVLLAAGLGTYVLLRGLYSVKQYYSDLYYLPFNLTAARTWLYALALFGPFLYLAWHRFSSKPKFLRRALLMTPFFLVTHFTMTIMVEPRLWLPLVPLFIASSFWEIIPGEYRRLSAKEPVAVPTILARFPKTGYAALLAVFLVFFAGFFVRYKSMHLGDRDAFLRAETAIKEGKRYAQSGMYDRAVDEFNRALALRPASDEAHYEMAQLYDFRLFDREKALYHYEKTLETNPARFDKLRIDDEIERLRYALKK